MKKINLLGLLALLISSNVNAKWIDANGTVTSLATYANVETILVTLSTSGTDVAECLNKKKFAISRSISAEARARMYSMLLAAQATGRTVTVSYNDVGSCEPWDGNANVYRKITRLR